MTLNRESVSIIKDWNTPPFIIETIKRFFNNKIDLDPCSNEYSTVGATTNFSLPLYNGLKQSWAYTTIFVNPPYGRCQASKTTIKDWLWKCTEANARFGSEVIALIPVATNTKHWQENIFLNAVSICFLKNSRLKFWYHGHEIGKGAPMGCCLVYWGNSPKIFKHNFSSLGKVALL